jgi:hypothetical protein
MTPRKWNQSAVLPLARKGSPRDIFRLGYPQEELP